MKLLNIKNSWFSESDLRLDASYHLSDGPITKIKLKKSPYESTTLSAVSDEIFSGNIFKRIFVSSEDYGWKYLTGSDMVKSDINSDKYISKKYTSKLEKLRIHKDWILITCSGTIGNIAFTNDDFDGRIGTHDLIRVIPNDNQVLKGFLYAYLSSNYGKGLLTQSSYGGVVQHIEPHHIENLSIPVFPKEKQKEVHNLILEASQLKVTANKFLNDAVNKFEEKIEVSKTHLGFQYDKIKSSSLKSFHNRLDSQYQLLWKSLLKEQKYSIEYTPILELAKKIFVGGRGKRMYVNNGISFLSSSDMMLYNPKRNCKKVSKNTPGLKTMLVSKYDILISRSGTVGNTVIVGDDLSNTAISEHALRLVIDKDKVLPNYVFCYLKTTHGKRCLEASSFGSVIITLNEDLIGNIDLPIIDKESMDLINEKIENYISKMDLSTKKENQAIDLIEKEIESWQ
jgi:type I restriction enzyme S subunit